MKTKQIEQYSEEIRKQVVMGILDFIGYVFLILLILALFGLFGYMIYSFGYADGLSDGFDKGMQNFSDLINREINEWGIAYVPSYNLSLEKYQNPCDFVKPDYCDFKWGTIYQ